MILKYKESYIALFGVILFTVFETIHAGTYINESEDFGCTWTVLPETQEIEFEMWGTVTGYVSIGWGPSELMAEADAVVGWVDDTTGEVGIVDIWMPEYYGDLDPIQDAVLVSGYQDSDAIKTSITFRRKYSTGDGTDAEGPDYNFYDEPQWIVWAIAETEDYWEEMHQMDGAFKVNMFAIEDTVEEGEGKVTEPPIVDEIESGDLSYTSPNGKFTVAWSIPPAASADDQPKIRFDIECKCTGWVAIGSSNDEYMPNSDSWTGWVEDDTGEAKLVDQWMPDMLVPRNDYAVGGTDIHLEIIEGSQADGVTKLSFTRDLVDFDSEVDIPIKDELMYIVWGYHDDNDDYKKIHKSDAAGAFQVNLYSIEEITEVIPAAKTFENPGQLLITIVSTVVLMWIFGSLLQKLTYFFTVSGSSNAVTAGEISSDVASKRLSIATGVQSGGLNIKVKGIVSVISEGKDDEEDSSMSKVGKRGMSSNWEKYTTKDGVTYYYNKDTEETTWEEPKELRTISSRVRLSFGRAVRKSAVRASNGVRAPLSPRRMRPPSERWEQNYAPDGKTYWFNPDTNESVWTKPEKNAIPSSLQARITKSIRLSNRLSSKLSASKSHLQSRKSTTINDLGEIPIHTNRTSTAMFYRGSTLVAEDRDADSINIEQPNITKMGIMAGGILSQRMCKQDYTLSEVLSFFVFVIVNVLCLYVGADRWSLGVRLGYLCGPNSLFVALPATRNSFFVWLLDIPFEKAILWHRWLGRWVILLAGAHTALCAIDWNSAGMDVYGMMFSNSKYHVGVYALASSFIIGLTSITWMRRKHFNTFIVFHFLFVVYYVFAALHSKDMRIYSFLSLAAYIFDRLFRYVWGMAPLITQEFKVVGNGIIRCRFAKHKLSKWLGRYSPAQYLFLNFPGVSMIEWHPYTISSAPSDNMIEVHIKVLGDHTYKVLDHAQKYTTTTVRAEGPYGSSELFKNFFLYDQLVMVSGGIGVTPAMSVISEIYRVGGDFTDAPPPLPSCLKRVHFIWVVKNTEDAQLFAGRLMKAKAASLVDHLPNLKVTIYLTQEPGAPAVPDVPYKNILKMGRPDLTSALAEIPVSDNVTAVMVCGPSKLVQETSDVASKRCRHGEGWDYHCEVFDW